MDLGARKPQLTEQVARPGPAGGVPGRGQGETAFDTLMHPDRLAARVGLGDNPPTTVVHEVGDVI